MIYILHGEEPVLLNQYLDDLINKNKNFNLVRYDGSLKEFDLKEVLYTWTNVDLFGGNSLIFLNDPPFFFKKEESEILDNFIKYSEHQDNDNILVLYSLNNSFKTTLKTFKSISSNAKVIKYDKLKKFNFYNAAINLLKENNLILDKQTTNALINASNCSLSDLILNIKVLKLYPGKIDYVVIKNLLSVPINYESFDLINAICEKNISKSEKLINHMIEEKDSIVGLISLLAGQLRFLYFVSCHLNNGETPKSISQKFNYNEYRVTKASECLSRLKQIDILRLLNLLADLDLKVKTTNDIPQKTLFELFLLELINDR